MHHPRLARRSVLLVFTLLSACAASGASDTGGESDHRAGAAGYFLSGRFAASQSDMTTAANDFLKALALDPASPALQQQAFVSTLVGGRPEALRLAREQPNNPAAQMLLGDDDAVNGRWEAAEARFAALPRTGLTQVLQPLLAAWAQFGAGQPDAALAGLRPYVEGQRFRAVYALHAAMIADLANRTGDAARLYQVAQTEFGASNLQLARMLASWQARQGNVGEAQQTIRSLMEQSDDLAIAGPALQADVANRQVKRATDGMAEAYLALAAALRAQDANDFAALLLRLALDLRPELTPARLLSAEVADGGRHPDAALRMLAPVRDDDPLIGVVKLRRAALTDRLGRTDEALRMLDELAREYPDRPEPETIRGDVLRTKKRFPEAVAAYDRAVARLMQPGRSNWPLFYDRGIALERSRQWPQAERDFEHALELSPDQPYVLNYLGYSWTEQGRNLDRAKQMIQRAVEQRPNDGSLLDSLGWVTLKQGDVPSAVRFLERAVELDSEDATVNAHLGDAYWAAHRKLEAQFQWRRALNLNPDPDDAAKLEAKLRDVDVARPPATAERSTP